MAGMTGKLRGVVDQIREAILWRNRRRLSRSQMVRLVLEDFLARDTAEQQELIVRGLFGRSKG